MLTLVTGGGASGKSGWAEAEAVRLAGGGPLFYLATLSPDGPGNDVIIARHRERRKGKGFVTVEASRDIDRIPALMQAENATVLLECLSNLLADEMFGGTGDGGSTFAEPDQGRGGSAAENVLREVLSLSRQVKHLVVVSNLIFSDGIVYEKETADYIRSLGLVNASAAAYADRVFEIVCGCPVCLKGKTDASS